MEYDIGMIGLGVMGENLVLNMVDHGFSVAGYDTSIQKVEALNSHGNRDKIGGATTLQEFVSTLRRPRSIMLLVPAGPPVDSVLDALTPLLQPGDLIIDAGNSYFKDTNVRAERLSKLSLFFFGMGISGGEDGARYGASIMPGGPKEPYERIRPILEAVSAKVGASPCVEYLGTGSAGHFVKMVHNGIEYGIMQLLAESYDLMKRGWSMSDDEIHEVFTSWNKGDLESYLLEITGKIFTTIDEKTKNRLIDVILDVAKQNGTGMWTSQSAMELRVPTPTITLAVGMRNMSMIEDQRKQASALFHRPIRQSRKKKEAFFKDLCSAYYVGAIITYAEGMNVLRAASETLKYQYNLETIARIWRGGCIIRAALLERIRAAFTNDPLLPNLLLDAEIAKSVQEHEEGLREIVKEAAYMGIPAPGFMTALSYFDGYRSSWLPANLIQAQRDFFGAHTYERIDAKGTFHTHWEQT